MSWLSSLKKPQFLFYWDCPFIFSYVLFPNLISHYSIHPPLPTHLSHMYFIFYPSPCYLSLISIYYCSLQLTSVNCLLHFAHLAVILFVYSMEANHFVRWFLLEVRIYSIVGLWPQVPFNLYQNSRFYRKPLDLHLINPDCILLIFELLKWNVFSKF